MPFLVVICANQRIIPEPDISLHFPNQLKINLGLSRFKALAHHKFIKLVSSIIPLGQGGAKYDYQLVLI